MQAANTLTALPNGRYVNVRMERMRQGLELAQRGAVTLPEDGEDLTARLFRRFRAMWLDDCPPSIFEEYIEPIFSV